MPRSGLNANKPDQQHTIEDYILSGAGNATITWYNFSLLQPMDAEDKSAQFQFEFNSLVNDYLDILNERAEKVTMSAEEQKKYYYNPELLAYDMYGSTEMDFIILRLNGMVDPKEFDVPTIKLVRQSDLISILSDIYNAERKYISGNRNKYNIPNFI